MEPVEAAAIGNELRPLLLEYLPASPTARFMPKQADEQIENWGINFGRRSPHGVGPWAGHWSGCGFGPSARGCGPRTLRAHLAESEVETAAIVDLDESWKVRATSAKVS
jgi:hypothetical protein